MVNVVSLVHFRDKKVSSKLNVDAVDPFLDAKGYVKGGGFFLKLMTEGESMKLSIQEATELTARLNAEVNRLITLETQMKVQRALNK